MAEALYVIRYVEYLASQNLGVTNPQVTSLGLNPAELALFDASVSCVTCANKGMVVCIDCKSTPLPKFKPCIDCHGAPEVHGSCGCGFADQVNAEIDRPIPLDSCDHPDISCFECSFSHECTRYGIKDNEPDNDDEEYYEPDFHCRNLGIMDCGACNDCNPAPVLEFHGPHLRCGRLDPCFDCPDPTSLCDIPF